MKIQFQQISVNMKKTLNIMFHTMLTHPSHGGLFFILFFLGSPNFLDPEREHETIFKTSSKLRNL